LSRFSTVWLLPFTHL